MDEAKLKDLAERYVIAETGDINLCNQCGGTIIKHEKPSKHGDWTLTSYSTKESGSLNCTWEGGQYGRYTNHSPGMITEELGDPEEIIELIIEEIRGK